MIKATTFSGKTVAVFGLGGSGLAACRSLLAGGATVAAWDDGTDGRDRASAAGIPLINLREADWSDVSGLVLAPGVPLTHPTPHWTVTLARDAGVEIIGDVEIFFRERAQVAPEAPVVAITGTNGKSTTTALIGHVLAACGETVAVGGNIGVNVLDLPDVERTTTYVLELSSYQIDLTPSLAPTIGLLLNITPDHIDRHGTFENYAAVKARLVSESQTALINIDDPAATSVAAQLRSTEHPACRTVSTNTQPDGPNGYGLSGTEIGCWRGDLQSFSPIAEFVEAGALRGAHNRSNVVFAAAVADLLDVDVSGLSAAFRGFPGLAHRLQPVAELATPHGRVLFVNDSKATNADSTEKALGAFDRDIYWIAGGRAKDGGIAALSPYFKRVAKAYLVGESAGAFASTLGSATNHTIAGTIEAAVEMAASDAAASGAPEPVVLLSPACASFDQFRNFELRGDAFVAAVASLSDITLRASVSADPGQFPPEPTSTNSASGSGAAP